MRISFIAFFSVSLLGGCATSSDREFRKAYYGTLSEKSATIPTARVTNPCELVETQALMKWVTALPDRKQDNHQTGLWVQSGPADCYKVESGSSQVGKQ